MYEPEKKYIYVGAESGGSGRWEAGETGNAYNTNLKVSQVALLRYLRMPQLVVFPSAVVVGVYANLACVVCVGAAPKADTNTYVPYTQLLRNIYRHLRIYS